MFWATGRKTARIEDRASCLMGLFEVNMPLLYGEGTRAFLRLQEEIMKRSSDESLLAWCNGTYTEGELSYHQGLLATSPDNFAYSGNFIQRTYHERIMPFSMTNRGLRLEIMIIEAEKLHESSRCAVRYDSQEWVHIAISNCIDEVSQKMIGVPLVSSAPSTYYGELHSNFFRLTTEGVAYIKPADPILLENQTTIFADPAVEESPSMGPLFHKSFRPAVALKTSLHFYLFDGTSPKASFVTVGNGTYIRECKKKIEWQQDYSTALGFDSGVDAFVVYFGFLDFRPWIQVHQQPPGIAQQEGFVPEEVKIPEYEIEDRATHRLASGEVVSFSLRPQQGNEGVFYVLGISK